MSTSTLSTTEETPTLRIETLTDSNERLDGLRLVADSVAQQAQVAAVALAWHPLCLSGLILILSAVVAFVGRYADYGAILTACSGVVLTYLMTSRYLTSGYVQRAETTDWLDWLRDPETGKEDLILGVRYGNDIIGATVLRLEPKSNDKNSQSLTQRRAAIRAWTVKARYRSKGLGADMLVESVAVAERLLGKGLIICFADDHANSDILLFKPFRKEFEDRDLRARSLLAETVTARRKSRDRKMLECLS